MENIRKIGEGEQGIVWETQQQHDIIVKIH